MKYIKLLLLLTLFFCINIEVNAACDPNVLKDLKEIAKKVEFSYDYTVRTETNSDEGTFIIVDFDIMAVNLNENIKTLIIDDYYMDDYKEFKYNKSKQYTLKGFSSGEKVNVTFKAWVNNECAGETVYTKTISLPYYNTFRDREECILYPDFKYCKDEIVNSLISNNMFMNEFEKYLNNDKNDEVIEENPKTEKNYSEYIGLAIIVIIIAMAIMLIVLKIVKERKKKEL